ncbi:hypothetical protein L3Y34_011219 [Caenorhabditis briggsae]|uniref:Uncharacterized protein n=1 Tax=Caenorhabditis briggsae TaxID=6238 RepID=A0AAE9CU62_CAEBR|nr:hypothetical protein L3Y34_011219 [Caenorhabditis briggsae]
MDLHPVILVTPIYGYSKKYIGATTSLSPHFEPPERFLLLTLAAGHGFLEVQRQTIETFREVCQRDDEQIYNKTMFETLIIDERWI